MTDYHAAYGSPVLDLDANPEYYYITSWALFNLVQTLVADPGNWTVVDFGTTLGLNWAGTFGDLITSCNSVDENPYVILQLTDYTDWPYLEVTDNKPYIGIMAPCRSKTTSVGVPTNNLVINFVFLYSPWSDWIPGTGFDGAFFYSRGTTITTPVTGYQYAAAVGWDEYLLALQLHRVDIPNDTNVRGGLAGRFHPCEDDATNKYPVVVTAKNPIPFSSKGWAYYDVNEYPYIWISTEGCQVGDKCCFSAYTGVDAPPENSPYCQDEINYVGVPVDIFQWSHSTIVQYHGRLPEWITVLSPSVPYGYISKSKYSAAGYFF